MVRMERQCCLFSGSILHHRTQRITTRTEDSSHYWQQKEPLHGTHTTESKNHIKTTCLDWRFEINCVGNSRWTSFMTSVIHYTWFKTMNHTCLIPFFNRAFSTRAFFFNDVNCTRSCVCTWNTNTRRSRSHTSFGFRPRLSITITPFLIESLCNLNE